MKKILTTDLKRIRRFIIGLLGILVVFPAFSKSNSGSSDKFQEHKPLREEVEVINVEVPVRVYAKKKPVKGLTKEDFKLLSDGVEIPINGFYEAKKQLQAAPQQTNQVPRLFVLLFNISSTSGDLEKEIDEFFRRVVRVNDRIIVLTNTMFLNDQVVEDPLPALKKVKKILEMETVKVQQKIFSMESNLRFLTSNLKYDISNLAANEDPELKIGRFLANYLTSFQEFKNVFFNLPEEQYIRVAQYLNRQQVDKWIIFFYEIPMFPQLRISGGILYKYIDDFYIARRRMNPYIFDVLIKLQKPEDEYYIEHISKIFLNTGAAFHTLLVNAPAGDFFEELEYKPTSTDSEHIFRRLSQLTNGKVMSFRKMEKFVKGISAVEDFYYVLTYVPKSPNDKGKSKIEVLLTNEKYRNAHIIYDDQHRDLYFRKIDTRVGKDIPHLRIRDVSFRDGLLSVGVEGIQQVQPQGETEESEKKGKIVLSIKLLDEKAVVIANTQKAFDTKVAAVPLRLRLPGLKAGEYQVYLEVKDLNSGSNDLMFEDILNPRDYELSEGQEPFQLVKTPVLNIPDGAETGIERPAEFEEIEPQDRLLQQQFPKESPDSFAAAPFDQSRLGGILKKVADYCQQLEAVSLNFFCIETIDEKFVNKMDNQGGILKKKSTTHTQLEYGYHLVREGKEVQEKRILLKQNGWKQELENAELKTRFKYKHIVYGPSIFNKHSQPYYQYTVLGKRAWNDRSALVIEAVPNTPDRRFAAGRLWVDEFDSSILRIEIYQQSIENFPEILERAKGKEVEPQITIINEYNFVRNGIRFPSKVYYEEAYRRKDGSIIIQSQAYVNFSDYQFFTVDTKVTY